MNENKKSFLHHVGKVLLLVLFGGGGAVSCFLWLTRPMSEPGDDVLSNRNYYIAHAAGALNGYRYMNCREALIKTLNNGYKYIEFDLGLTSDSILVCLHDWRLFHKMTSQDSLNDQPISVNEFRFSKIYSEYTPLTVEDVISIRKNRPFVIVIDKVSKVEILNKFFTCERNEIMVEAYTVNEFKMLKDAGYTPMMSLQRFGFYKLMKYFIFSPLIKQQMIDWICIKTTSDMKALRLLKRLFVCKVAMYTSNSQSFFEEHLGKEVDLVYTDATTTLKE